MGAFSLSHILVVALLAVLLFGRGKVTELMGDVAKGIKSFKRGMAEDDQPSADRPLAVGQSVAGAATPAPPRDETPGA